MTEVSAQPRKRPKDMTPDERREHRRQYMKDYRRGQAAPGTVRNIHDLWAANRTVCERDAPERWAEMWDAHREIQDVRYWVSNYFGKHEEWATARFEESLPDLDIKEGDLIFPDGVEAGIVQQIDELIAKYGEEVYPLVDSHYFHNMPMPEGQENVILVNEATDFGKLKVDDTFRRYGLIVKVPKGLKEALRSQVRAVGPR